MLDYTSVLLKELIESWGEGSGFLAPDMLCDHLEELFGEGDYKVEQASVVGDLLELQISSSRWEGTFHCALDSAGKLVYDRRPPKRGE